MIPYSTQSIDQSDIEVVSKALKQEILTGGSLVDEFEKALCEYVGVKYAVVLNSATSALHCAYLALGIKKDDEVITTPMTFAATSNAVLMCGANVKFCDIKFDGNIDEEKIEALITKNTKAISVVDYGGNSVKIDKILQIAKKHNIKVLDDASHALGSKFNGKNVGSFADCSIFSFHPVKPITTLEGGAVLTNDESIAQKVRLLRTHGISKKELWDSDMSMLGFNYRLSDVACALGINQLAKLDKMIQIRNEIADFYENKFNNNPYFSTIKIATNKLSSRHLYPILLHRELYCVKEDIFTELKNRGIGTQVHYKPTYKFSFYRNLYGEISLKNTEDFYKAELTLPAHQNMSLDDAKFVAKNIFEVLEKFKNRCKI